MTETVKHNHDLPRGLDDADLDPAPACLDDLGPEPVAIEWRRYATRYASGPSGSVWCCEDCGRVIADPDHGCEHCGLGQMEPDAGDALDLDQPDPEDGDAWRW